MRAFVAAVRFLTRIPMPGAPTTAADLPGAVGWFPVVGMLVGACTAGVFVAGSRVWPATVAAVLAVAAGLLLTGGFHEDGFSDAFDGLGGGWTRERVLAIMKDSRIGAYGSMALWALLMLRWSCLVSLGGKAIVVLPFAMALGRWSIALVLRLLPSISEGLAKEVHRQSGTGTLLFSSMWALLAIAGAWHWGVTHVAGAAGAALVVTLLWTAYLRRRMGGHSGDLLGAGNQLVEAAVLLAVLLT